VVRRWRRTGAGAGLLLLVAAGVLVIGGGLAAVLAMTIDDRPAEEQAADEAGDVVIVRCRESQGVMSARIRVTNRSSEPSDYYLDIEFQRIRGDRIEAAPAIVEDLAAGETRPLTVLSARPAPRGFACEVGDVDRLAA
jgi:hypothetical protein